MLRIWAPPDRRIVNPHGFDPSGRGAPSVRHFGGMSFASRGAIRAAGGGEWTPADLGSALALWLDADLGITLNGSNVSAWADQGPDGEDASQASATEQPLYVTSWRNGHNAIQGATGDYLNLPTFATAVTQPNSVYAVLEWQDTGRYLADGQIIYASGTGTLAINAGGAFAASSVSVANGTAVMARSIVNGASSSVRAVPHGAAAADESGLDPGTNSLATGSILADSGSVPFTGKIATLIVVRGILSAGDDALLESYLLDRYAIVPT